MTLRENVTSTGVTCFPVASSLYKLRFYNTYIVAIIVKLNTVKYFALRCIVEFKNTMAYSGLPEKFVCVDVECVASGPRHDDRSVAYVALVDKDERVLLKKKVKPDKPVFNFLTPLTGLKEGDLDGAPPLEEVVREVKALIGPNVVLVGQGVQSDIAWLDLKVGVDFASSVDLGNLFKTYNSRYGNYSFFSLQHEANMLLQKGSRS